MPKAKAPTLFGDDDLNGAPDSTVKAAHDCYNATAKDLPWRQATLATEAARKTLRRALRDYGGIVGFQAAMLRAARSPFLLGSSGRTGVYKNWRPTLAFFCQPKSIENLLDGVYDPVPEEPKRLYIPPPQAAYRRKEEAPFVPESQEVREQAMIDSYRRHGKYADANRIEQARADRLGVPAVLVPDPAVAWVTAPPKPAPERHYSVPTMASAADLESRARNAAMKMAEPPEYTEIAEGDYEIIEPD